jgi:subtilase family serine protease
MLSLRHPRRGADAARAAALVALLAGALPHSALAQNLPDLVVGDISFSPTPVPGAAVMATARLTNIGNASSGSFNVKWFVNGAQVGYGGHPSLGPGQTSTGNVQLAWTMGSGDTLFRFDADVDGNVAEEGEVNNSYQALVRNGSEVPLADLRVEGMSLGGTPRVGEQTIVTASLRNIGQASSGSFNVKWFVDGGQVGYGAHSSLAPGQLSTDNVRLFWTPTQPGTHRLRFAADVDGNVLESNETNDQFEATWNVQPALPDLVVEDVSFSSPPTVGQQTRATAHLRNAGSSASGGFNIKWFLDGVQVGYGFHTPLGAGQLSTDNVYFFWTPSDGGTHRLRYEADVDHQVQETSETNNAFERTVAVIDNRPDLVAEDITFSSPPTLGVPTTATARLRNAGASATGTFAVKWFLDGVQVGYGGHAPLGPGQVSTDNVRFSWTPASPGLHQLRFAADVDSQVGERDESNNVVSRAIDVIDPRPDLRVDDIAFTSLPTLGQPTTAIARLSNIGRSDSVGFTVKWFLDGVEVGYGAHDPLPAGQTSSGNVRFSWTPASPGPHRLRFAADVDGNVEEASEANNAWEEQVDVIDPRPDLVVESITFSTPPAVGCRRSSPRGSATRGDRRPPPASTSSGSSTTRRWATGSTRPSPPAPSRPTTSTSTGRRPQAGSTAGATWPTWTVRSARRTRRTTPWRSRWWSSRR